MPEHFPPRRDGLGHAAGRVIAHREKQEKLSLSRFTHVLLQPRQRCQPSSAVGAAGEDLLSDRAGLLGSSSSAARTLLEHTLLQRNHKIKAEAKPSELTFPIEAAP